MITISSIAALVIYIGMGISCAYTVTTWGQR